jgi:hypothetical protein
MTLCCCLCLFLREGEATEAVTVMSGHAVCEDHMGYVQGGDFSRRLRFAREQENINQGSTP